MFQPLPGSISVRPITSWQLLMPSEWMYWCKVRRLASWVEPMVK